MLLDGGQISPPPVHEVYEKSSTTRLDIIKMTLWRCMDIS